MFCAGVVIGLIDTIIVVAEGDGIVEEVCARVLDGELETDAVVTLQTMHGSAVSWEAEPDYQILSIQLTFTPRMIEMCCNVTILNDMFYEDPEDLTVVLTTDEPYLTLMPDVGTITILDEDG